MHSEIIGMAIRGEMTLPGMRQNFADISFRGEVNRVVRWPELELRGKVDLWAEKEGVVVEIKPGIRGKKGKKQLRGGWVLQTACNCRLTNAKLGVIYLYNNQASFTLEQGGQACWEEIRKIADYASQILEIRKVQDRQEQLKRQKKKQRVLPVAQIRMDLWGGRAVEVWNVGGVEINLPDINKRVSMGIGLSQEEIDNLSIASVQIRKKLDPLAKRVVSRLVRMVK